MSDITARADEGLLILRSARWTYALLDSYDGVILLDASRRGGAPVTLYVIDPELDEWAVPDADEALADAHGMNLVETFV